MVELDGHIVIITGAGRGLGRAYALDAARRGAVVVVNDRDAEVADEVVAQIAEDGGRAAASAHPVDDAAAVDELVTSTVARFGRLDGMAINAGVYHEAAPEQETAATAERAVRVNVLGAIYCLSAAARPMTAAGRGSIVIASSAGALGSRRIMTYAATKGALASLMYAAALDLEPCGVRVNAIAPVAMTRMTAGAVGRQIVPEGTGRPLLAAMEQRPPEAVAPLVSYLLSDAAAGVTGQFVRFDGERLGLLPQAALADIPVVTGRHWSAEQIAEAFAGPLRARLQPFGVERRVPPASR